MQGGVWGSGCGVSLRVRVIRSQVETVGSHIQTQIARCGLLGWNSCFIPSSTYRDTSSIQGMINPVLRGIFSERELFETVAGDKILIQV